MVFAGLVRAICTYELTASMTEYTAPCDSKSEKISTDVGGGHEVSPLGEELLVSGDCLEGDSFLQGCWP